MLDIDDDWKLTNKPQTFYPLASILPRPLYHDWKGHINASLQENSWTEIASDNIYTQGDNKWGIFLDKQQSSLNLII
jgi:hypothetical protein